MDTNNNNSNGKPTSTLQELPTIKTPSQCPQAPAHECPDVTEVSVSDSDRVPATEAGETSHDTDVKSETSDVTTEYHPDVDDDQISSHPCLCRDSRFCVVPFSVQLDRCRQQHFSRFVL